MRAHEAPVDLFHRRRAPRLDRPVDGVELRDRADPRRHEAFDSDANAAPNAKRQARCVRGADRRDTPLAERQPALRPGLDTLEREGSVAAGRLAEVLGLTSGAITTVLDRLERSGYARRVHDPDDRRRVLVELTPRTQEIVEFYKAHEQLSKQLYARYTRAQLELLLKFVRDGREFNEQRAAIVEEQNRVRSKVDRPGKPSAVP
jgi:DNA-binding MarR family transcriptional regulator